MVLAPPLRNASISSRTENHPSDNKIRYANLVKSSQSISFPHDTAERSPGELVRAPARRKRCQCHLEHFLSYFQRFPSREYYYLLLKEAARRVAGRKARRAVAANMVTAAVCGRRCFCARHLEEQSMSQLVVEFHVLPFGVRIHIQIIRVVFKINKVTFPRVIGQDKNIQPVDAVKVCNHGKG